MNRLAFFLVTASLSSLAACRDVTGPQPAQPAEAQAGSDAASDAPSAQIASSDETADTDAMLRDASERLAAALEDEEQRLALQRQLEALREALGAGDTEGASGALAKARELVASYDGSPGAADAAAIRLALEQVAVLLGV